MSYIFPQYADTRDTQFPSRHTHLCSIKTKEYTHFSHKNTPPFPLYIHIPLACTPPHPSPDGHISPIHSPPRALEIHISPSHTHTPNPSTQEATAATNKSPHTLGSTFTECISTDVKTTALKGKKRLGSPEGYSCKGY